MRFLIYWFIIVMSCPNPQNARAHTHLIKTAIHSILSERHGGKHIIINSS